MPEDEVSEVPWETISFKTWADGRPVVATLSGTSGETVDMELTAAEVNDVAQLATSLLLRLIAGKLAGQAA